MDRFFKPWLAPAPASYLFVNAEVVDTVNGKIIPKATVHIANGHIVSVGLDGTEEAPEGTIRVDLNGKYLCPGLIDAHVHIAAPPGEKGLQALTKVHEHFILYRTTYVCRDILSRGFTTVRDAGGAPLALKEAIQDGLIPGLVCRLQDTPSARQAGMVTFATPTSIRLWNVDVAKSLELHEYVTESPNVCTWQGMS